MMTPQPPREFRIDPYVFDAARFAQERLHWCPDAVQAKVLNNTKNRVILNWGRQSGKSTVAAAKMVHVAVTIPETVCVWMSANKEHTAEVFAKMEGFLSRVGITAKGERGKQKARTHGDNPIDTAATVP